MQTIVLQVNWETALGEMPSGAEMAAVMSCIDRLYRVATDSMGYPPHNLRVSEMRHPNMSVTIEGIGEAAGALKDLIIGAPDLIARLFSLRALTRAERAEAEARIAKAQEAKSEAETKALQARLDMEINEGTKEYRLREALAEAERRAEAAQAELEVLKLTHRQLGFEHKEDVFAKVAAVLQDARGWDPEIRRELVAEAIKYVLPPPDETSRSQLFVSVGQIA